MKVLILSCSTGGGHNACARYIHDELKSNKIVCGHTIDNKRSKKIILKNNFKFTHMDDTRIFSVDSIKEVLMYELDNPYKKEHKKWKQI